MTDGDSTIGSDVIVIGGGVAGLIAARDLGHSGHRCLLLEARRRLGGRVYPTEFAGQGIEAGGGEITFTNTEWIKELQRYSIETSVWAKRESDVYAEVDGRLLSGVDAAVPIPYEEGPAFEDAMYQLGTAARRLKPGSSFVEQSLDDLDISITDWVSSLELPGATGRYLNHLLGQYVGGDPRTVSLIQFIEGYAKGNADAFLQKLYFARNSVMVPNSERFLEAVASDAKQAGVEVRLESPVARIEQNGSSVTVTTRGGETITSRAAVLAAPLNTWRDIDFVGLSDAKREFADLGHAGDVHKLHVLARNVPVFYGRTVPSSLDDYNADVPAQMFATFLEVPEFQAHIVQGWVAPGGLDPTDIAAVQNALRVFAPEAEVLELQFHNWNEDEFARGAWVATRAGMAVRRGSVLSAPEGRVHFAGADVTPDHAWLGNIEGAIRSAANAASAVSNQLGSSVA